jgi:hypothetical protein
MTAGDVLAGVSDRVLLAAIRRGDVSLLAGVMAGSGYWRRNAAIRGEARRRGVL